MIVGIQFISSMHLFHSILPRRHKQQLLAAVEYLKWWTRLYRYEKHVTSNFICDGLNFMYVFYRYSKRFLSDLSLSLSLLLSLSLSFSISLSLCLSLSFSLTLSLSLLFLLYHSQDLGTDTSPQTLARCAEFLVHHKQFEKAIGTRKEKRSKEI